MTPQRFFVIFKKEVEFVREISDIVEKRNAFWFFCVSLMIVLVLTFSGTAFAAVRYSRIEKITGFRFENLVYAWDKLVLDVVNTTPDNSLFGGTMIFLDRRGKPLASASLLPKEIVGLNSERYNAYFVTGSGEAARRATRVIWDFVTR